ncbi:uracil-DNA glycosylase [Sphingomonas ginsenosidimutans]|jgi:uracil-DNA glycosylase family 4|uniref:Type-5 uracil-DNA glycosylase n=1 Tax=Sphingomonas ginsenosidimutans TaxID=862134 RepID=A0A2A4HZ45_9SPHN|nr:uracil-DNA glycosylase [Sphingomonas ginsenosidimutans]PCG09273.1 uracil-DNA glycosylase [Sphingomonas ginsenosidimutans]
MDFAPSPLPETEPPRDCPRCPRLVAVRAALRIEHPDWWNAPVRAFGDPDAWLAIVGLAPGKQGANRTGRPFTGDYSGDLLFNTLARYGLATGQYEGSPADTLALTGAVIINAVKCLPPENKPTPEEIRTCRPFLEGQAGALPNARVFVALGQIAHQSIVKVLGGKLPKARFGHLAEHRMPDGRILIDSYHCSRYNQNTGRLTPEMFAAVFERALAVRDQAVPRAS